MFPDGSVTSIEEMRTKVRVDYEAHFRNESDRKLKNDIVLRLLKETRFDLPDAFLKRWLSTTDENKSSTEDIEKEYPSYSDGLRWQLIENKVIREHGLKVSEEELKTGVRAQLHQQFAQYGIQQADDEMMDDMVERFMKREDEVRKVREQLYDHKVMEVFKEKATLKEKTLDSEAFYNMLSKENG